MCRESSNTKPNRYRVIILALLLISASFMYVADDTIRRNISYSIIPYHLFKSREIEPFVYEAKTTESHKEYMQNLILQLGNINDLSTLQLLHVCATYAPIAIAFTAYTNFPRGIIAVSLTFEPLSKLLARSDLKNVLIEVYLETEDEILNSNMLVKCFYEILMSYKTTISIMTRTERNQIFIKAFDSIDENGISIPSRLLLMSIMKADYDEFNDFFTVEFQKAYFESNGGSFIYQPELDITNTLIEKYRQILN